MISDAVDDPMADAPRHPIALSAVREDEPRPSWLRRVAPWLPLGLLLLVIIASALGHGPVPPASALTATQGITVNGIVDKEVHLVPSCSGAALDLGSLVPND